jgi:hypothetical protein
LVRDFEDMVIESNAVEGAVVVVVEVGGSLIALGERVISAAKLVRRASAVVKFEES